MHKNINNYLKISELSKLTGVPVSTIHYYVRLGLLPSPKKTHLNMAYYDEKCVELIEFIKELQNRRFVPLEHIKNLFDHIGADKMPSSVLFDTHKFLFDYKPPGEKLLTRKELLKSSGLTEKQLEELEALNLVLPPVEEKSMYDIDDLRAVLEIKKLLEMGAKTSEIAYYPRLISEIIDEDMMLHTRLTCEFHDADPVKLSRITESLMESARTAREYYFKRLFQRKVFDHLKNHVKQEKVQNKINKGKKKEREND